MGDARRNPLGETTIPVHSTLGTGERGATTSIRWVFPDPVGHLTHLEGTRLLLGRGEDCTVRLLSGGASRHHAEIVKRGPTWMLKDLASTNGVFVNGARTQETFLSDGLVLRLGDHVGIVVENADPASSAFFGELAPGLLGGPVMRPLLAMVARAAASTLPIILEGETGTGKEVFARTIHHLSSRSGPFLAVNCAAVPEALAEGELFGYRKGAFTSAERASPGLFRSAEAGTVLLDEIVDMPLSLQAKVLRVLEQHEVVPLGEARPAPVDVRIIAAAQLPLSQAVAERKFRADLLARLNGLTVRIPPLRDRKEEIPFLFSRMLATHSSGRAPPVEARLVEHLCLYDWPFNVRELDLCTRRLLTLHGHEPVLKRSHLPQDMIASVRSEGRISEAPVPSPSARPAESRRTDADSSPEEQNKRDLEAMLIALRAHQGNVARAAAAVGISRQRAYRLMDARPDVDWDELRGRSG